MKDEGAELFTCPRCGAASHNPNDVREDYCGQCHMFTGRAYFVVTHLNPPLGPHDEFPWGVMEYWSGDGYGLHFTKQEAQAEADRLNKEEER